MFEERPKGRCFSEIRRAVDPRSSFLDPDLELAVPRAGAEGHPV